LLTDQIFPCAGIKARPATGGLSFFWGRRSSQNRCDTRESIHARRECTVKILWGSRVVLQDVAKVSRGAARHAAGNSAAVLVCRLFSFRRRRARSIPRGGIDQCSGRRAAEVTVTLGAKNSGAISNAPSPCVENPGSISAVPASADGYLCSYCGDKRFDELVIFRKSGGPEGLKRLNCRGRILPALAVFGAMAFAVPLIAWRVLARHEGLGLPLAGAAVKK